MIIRIFDLILSIVGLVLLSPLLIVLLIVGLFDTGNPIYIQRRVGLNQKHFNLIKFRTMIYDTPPMGTHEVDPESITNIGRVLRKYKIDELPQLLNVIKGDMSLVGPRPCLPSQVDVIKAREPSGIFRVKPGITGLSQLRNIDMSTPEKLSTTDQQMIESMNIKKYFQYIFSTIFTMWT